MNKRSWFKKLAATMLALAMSLMPWATGSAYAVPKEISVQAGDFTFTLYDDGGTVESIWLTGYTGTQTEVTVPSVLVYNGVKYPIELLGENVFKGNTKITKVTILDSYVFIASNAFSGCTSLETVTIGTGIQYIGTNVFTGCPMLKTYRFGFKGGDIPDEVGIGKNSSGSIYSGVVAYVPVADPQAGKSNIETHLIAQNSASASGGGAVITINPVSNPAPGTDVIVEVRASDKQGGNTETNGIDGTPYGKGASESVMDRAITKYASEKDPKGTVFNILQAKINKVKKTSMAVKWRKASGAKKYIVYGNKCGKKNKMVRQTVTTKNAVTFKKVNGKKLKKGTYYKFIVVAIDGNGKVISTSKMVHAATKGGKVGNDKAVKVKKSKVKIKKGKKAKLGAKAVPQSKKLKVKRHRGIAYESSNPSVASVNKKGVVKGLKKGSCYVYAYAQCGVFKKVKITVK